MDYKSNGAPREVKVLTTNDQISEIIRVIDEHIPYIDRFLLSKGLSHLTDDITQDAFIALLKACEEQDISDVKAYFFIVIRNLTAQYYRKAEKREEVLKQILEKREIEIAPDVLVLYETEEQNELLQYVFSLMEVHLDDHSRKILQMKYLEGLTYKEISRITGKSEGSLRKVASRAIQLLRNLCS
jgi:RNA polymerase sigma-70 factor (ECF subfamily)